MIYPRNELGIDPLHHRKDKYSGKTEPLDDEEEMRVKQNSAYAETDKPRINNNLFFEERANPLSSKGD